MNITTYRISGAGRAARAQPEVEPRARWVQFGDEFAVYADDAAWPEVEEWAARSGASRERSPGPARPEHLHLVIQKGDLFQRAHPDVRVLAGGGRYLLVDLEPELARELDLAGAPCYAVRPVEERHVAYRISRPDGLRAAPDPEIQDLVGRLSTDSYRSDLTRLVQYGTRFSTSPQFATAAEDARRQLAGLGYATRLQPITVDGRSSQNVIAEQAGTGAGPRGVIIVSAHLDSINLQGGPLAAAPGADDDGSGSAGVLEIARLFQNRPGHQDLRLILFGGEEQGLFGSQQYVAGLPAAERSRVRAVVHMDMIGTRNSSGPSSVLLEGHPLSQAVIDGLAEAAAAYSQLTVQTSLDPHNSDHVSFIEAGIPAVLVIEGADEANHNIHKAEDTLQHVSFDLALDILRMNVAYTARALR